MQERFRTFTVYLAKINRNIRRLKAEKMKEFNLKTPHVSCIYYLYREGSLTAKELCDICEEDKSGVSRSIEQLEKEGYIECEEKVKKRYKSPLKLTEKGRELGKSLADIIEGVLLELSKDVPEEDLKTMYKVLGIISTNLENKKI